MANILEYTLSLQDKWSGVMRKIGITNNQQLETWAKVQKQVVQADNTMKNCGVTVGSLKQRVAALRAERDWIPAKSINDIRRINSETNKLERQIRKLESVSGGRLKMWFSNLKSSVPIVNMITNPLVLLGAAIYKIGNYLKESQNAWNIQMQGEVKLATVLRQRVKATDEEIESIKRLASAQQAIGVIGDEIQLAGAQQISTFVKRKDSIDVLLPAMNNLLAQQKGINATDQDAVNIGNLMGKVLQGQTSALTRVGITFTEAEERILKYGNEQERAATLAQVITNNVGEMNQALAATDAGALKQHANAMGDLQERVGQLYIQVKASLLPIFEWLRGILSDFIDWLGKNRNTILTIVNTIAQAFKVAFIVVLTPIKAVINTLGWWIDKLREGQPVVVLITGLIAAFGLALAIAKIPMVAMAAWAGIVSAAKLVWAGVQAILNGVLYACPIVWIITAIIALIAVIAYVCYKTEGWGSLWKGVVGFMKHTFLAYIETIKLGWTTMINGIMIGLDKIKLGWYKFKEACGIGNSEANQAAIAEINRDVEARKDAIVNGARKVAEHTNAAKESLQSIHMTWNKDKSIGGMIDGMKEKFGIKSPGVPGMDGGTGDGSGDGSGGTGSSAVESIATGGTRSTTINITLDNLIENIFYQGGFGENKDEFERDLESALIRVLQMAHTSK